jgi:hypothetical protein
MALTAENVIDAIRFRTTTDSGVLSDSDLFTVINQVHYDMINKIVEVKEDFFATDPFETTLSADVNKYAMDGTIMPSSILKIDSVEFAYDGTNYYRGDQIERDQIPNLNSETEWTDGATPRYDIWGSALYIWPTPSAADVTAGGKFRTWYLKRPTAISALTDVLAVPAEFEYILIDGCEYFTWNKLGQEQKAISTKNVYLGGLENMKRQLHDRDTSRMFGLDYTVDNYFNE